MELLLREYSCSGADVGADTVQFDFDQQDSEDSPPSKRKRKKKGKSISSSFDFQNPVDEPSLSTSNTTAPTALESFEILDDDSVDTGEYELLLLTLTWFIEVHFKLFT